MFWTCGYNPYSCVCGSRISPPQGTYLDWYSNKIRDCFNSTRGHVIHNAASRRFEAREPCSNVSNCASNEGYESYITRFHVQFICTNSACSSALRRSGGLHRIQQYCNDETEISRTTSNAYPLNSCNRNYLMLSRWKMRTWHKPVLCFHLKCLIKIRIKT